MRQSLHPATQSRGRKDLAAPEQPLQRREVVLRDDVLPGHIVQQRRRRKPLRQFMPANEVGDLVREQIQFGWDQMKLRARAQRSVDVESREIEMERRMAGDAILLANAEITGGPFDEAHHVVMFYL